VKLSATHDGVLTATQLLCTHVNLLLSAPLALQGAQAAVKLSATYDGMLTATQLLCYCCEGWMKRWGRGRIVARHGLVAGLLGLLVVVSSRILCCFLV
jgi:hypothetical protein